MYHKTKHKKTAKNIFAGKTPPAKLMLTASHAPVDTRLDKQLILKWGLNEFDPEQEAKYLHEWLLFALPANTYRQLQGLIRSYR